MPEGAHRFEPPLMVEQALLEIPCRADIEYLAVAVDQAVNDVARLRQRSAPHQRIFRNSNEHPNVDAF